MIDKDVYSAIYARITSHGDLLGKPINHWRAPVPVRWISNPAVRFVLRTPRRGMCRHLERPDVCHKVGQFLTGSSRISVDIPRSDVIKVIDTGTG
jgi:hypothetical protein